MSEPIRMDGQYQTRDGREVELWKIEDQIFGRIQSSERSGWVSWQWRTDGSDGGKQSNFDLVPVPKKHKRWVNFYAEGCETRERADYCASTGRIACIEVKFTEGEGLSPATEE